MKYIDLTNYPRRSHYEFFKSYAYPYMGITANVDVTELVNYAKAKGGSTFLACLWAAANAANAIPELRQRMVEDGIVEYDHCDLGHTVPMEDGTFCNCNTTPNCIAITKFSPNTHNRTSCIAKHLNSRNIFP